MISRDIWYDWGGANEWLFTHINGIHGGSYYDAAMVTLSDIANHHHFPYYMAGLAIFALLLFTAQKSRNKGGTTYILAAWLAALVVLAAGYAMIAVIIHFAKSYFSFPRPYMVLSHTTRVLEVLPPEDNYHSFPSGHAAFITLMVVGLWPVLSSNMRWLGAALIFAVCWSRIAMGAHFPMDVLSSVMLFIPLVIILRMIIYPILRNGFGVRC